MRNLTLFFALFLVSTVDGIAQGCSQCKLLAEQSSGLDESSFASNLNFGILYLMLFPYLILMFLFRKPIIRFFRSLITPRNTAN